MEVSCTPSLQAPFPNKTFLEKKRRRREEKQPPKERKQLGSKDDAQRRQVGSKENQRPVGEARWQSDDFQAVSQQPKKDGNRRGEGKQRRQGNRPMERKHVWLALCQVEARWPPLSVWKEGNHLLHGWRHLADQKQGKGKCCKQARCHLLPLPVGDAGDVSLAFLGFHFSLHFLLRSLTSSSPGSPSPPVPS